jgi:hemoglobin/transferrin/lactoferrin receptor protein
MKKLILVGSFLSFIFSANSQTLKIYNQETKKPVANATIMDEKTSYTTQTNSSGHADISAFIESERIYIYAEGFLPEQKSIIELKALSYKLFLEPKEINLTEIINNTAPFATHSDLIPAKISTITSNDAALQNPQTAIDLVDISGNVFVSKNYQAGGSAMFRGFANNRMLYKLDGITLNHASMSMFDLNINYVDPFALETTEIQYGPGGVYHNHNAVGGVLSFQTLTPQFSKGDKPLITGKAVTRYSTANNEKAFHFDVNVGWKKWASVTSFSSWEFGHLRQGAYGSRDYLRPYHIEKSITKLDTMRGNPYLLNIVKNDSLIQNPSAYSQFNIMQKIRFKPNKYWDFEYGFHYSETSVFSSFDKLQILTPDTLLRPHYADFNYGPRKWMMNKISIANTSKNIFYDRVNLSFAYQVLSSGSNENPVLDIFPLLSNYLYANYDTSKLFSANLDLKKTIAKFYTYNVGVEYIDNQRSGKAFVRVAYDNFTKNRNSYTHLPSSIYRTIGIYLHNTFNISDNLVLALGARYTNNFLRAELEDYTWISLTMESFVKKQEEGLLLEFSGIYSLNNNWLFRTRLSSNYHIPNIYDHFSNTFRQNSTLKFELKPETASNIEAGVTKTFGDVLKVELNGYHTLIDNALAIVEIDPVRYWKSLQNIKRSKVSGLQGSIQLNITSGLSFSTDINYQKGEEELKDGTKQPMTHLPPFFGTARVMYEYDKFRILFYANYSGEIKHKDIPVYETHRPYIYAKNGNGNVYSPSWYTLNLKVMYALSETFVFSGGVENITDQRYRPFTSGISRPGRNLVFSLRAYF